jgi:hypothetical protein
MIICKLLILVANFYSMWLIFECWNDDDFDDLKSNNLLHRTTCFGRLKVDHFFFVEESKLSESTINVFYHYFVNYHYFAHS